MSGGHIFPHATNEAAKTVDKHQETQDLVFWSGWFCPYNQRVWIALEEKGIPYQYKEVNPYHKEKDFLKINPRGQVPALEYKDRPIYESLIICEFLEDAFPEHKPNLLPSDAFTRAYARLWIDHFTKSVVPAFLSLLQAQEKDSQQEVLKELNGALEPLVEQVKGPYFLGDEWSLVDTAIAPFVVGDYILTEHRGYKREDIGEGQRWKEYVENLTSRESVVKTCSDKDKYEPLYIQYLKNKA